MKNNEIKAERYKHKDIVREHSYPEFEVTKSLHKTKFVSIRNYAGKGLSDIVPLFIGYEDCLPSHSFGPFARNSYLVHYVLSGKGKFFARGRSYDLKSGEYFIITPNEITTYTADKDTPWRYVWVAFNGTYAEELKNVTVPVGNGGTAVFKEIKQLVDDDANPSADLVTSLIFRFFAEIFSNVNSTKNTVAQIENYVNTQYMSNITVEGIAEAVGLDRRYLGRLFKTETGYSLQEYLITTRLNRAAELLKKGYKVGEAAVMSGYKDPFNFTKMFTKYFKCSPKAYAKLNK